LNFWTTTQLADVRPPGGWGPILGLDPPQEPEALLPPDWQDVNSADNAICYTRGWPMTLQVHVQVRSPEAQTPTLRVLGPDGIQGTSPIAAPCGISQQTVTITTTPLPDYVWRYETMPLNWSFQLQGESTWNFIRTTNHDIFVSYDILYGSLPTPRRIQHECIFGLGSSDPAWITDQIHISLNTGESFPPFNPHSPGVSSPWVNDWRLMAGIPYAGECHDQAHLMNLMMQIIGLPAGMEYLTYASTDSDPTNREFRTAADLGVTVDIDGDGSPGETDEWLELIFNFPGPPTPNLNNFEGSIQVGSTFYAFGRVSWLARRVNCCARSSTTTSRVGWPGKSGSPPSPEEDSIFTLFLNRFQRV